MHDTRLLCHEYRCHEEYTSLVLHWARVDMPDIRRDHHRVAPRRGSRCITTTTGSVAGIDPVIARITAAKPAIFADCDSAQHWLSSSHARRVLVLVGGPVRHLPVDNHTALRRYVHPIIGDQRYFSMVSDGYDLYYGHAHHLCLGGPNRSGC